MVQAGTLKIIEKENRDHRRPFSRPYLSAENALSGQVGQPFFADFHDAFFRDAPAFQGGGEDRFFTFGQLHGDPFGPDRPFDGSFAGILGKDKKKLHGQTH